MGWPYNYKQRCEAREGAAVHKSLKELLQKSAVMLSKAVYKNPLHERGQKLKIYEAFYNEVRDKVNRG